MNDDQGGDGCRLVHADDGFINRSVFDPPTSQETFIRPRVKEADPLRERYFHFPNLHVRERGGEGNGKAVASLPTPARSFKFDASRA
jgi:hypothetical protein